MTEARPAIVPTPANRFFWEGAGRGELLVLHCQTCGFLAYPSPDRCPRCAARAFLPKRMSGQGVVYSFTTVRRSFHPGFAADIPYVIGLVELPEQAGLRLLSGIVNTPPAAVRIGLPVAAVFIPAGAFGLVMFQPACHEAGR